jgi:hypothetical protein
MANSLSLKVINVGSNSSIYLNDIHDGKDQNGRVNNRKPYQYIPKNGAVTILFTEQVQYSYESGAIRSFIDQGLIQTFFEHGDLNYTSTDEDGISNHLDVTFQNGLYEISGPYDPQGALDFTGTDILIKAGTSNGAGQVGGALELNAGASLNGNGGGVEIRAGEGEVNGGGVYIYGNRGSTGTAGKVSIIGGDSDTDDGGNVEITGGPVWSGNKEGGNVNLTGGLVIDNVVATGGHINITGGGVGNFIGSSNGGDVNITSGAGIGAGRTSGNITLDPATGGGGASDGKVIIKGANVTLDNYIFNGLLGVFNGDGTVGVHYYGSQDFTIPDGLNNGEITFTVAGAFIIGTNLIILNVFAPSSVDINTPPVTYEINPGVNFKARLKATNGSGDPVGCKLFWVCI